MRFALLGDHPDGLDMTRALVESGRHELRYYSGPPAGVQHLKRWGLVCQHISDMEDLLAHSDIDLVIVAGSASDRGAMLRRAVQADHHVLCVHPADQTPDTAYEAGMIQRDTGKLLLPLLPDVLHPGLQRLAQLLEEMEKRTRVEGDRNGDEVQAPFLRLVELQHWSGGRLLLDADLAGHQPGLPGWDALRLVGGELIEVALLGPHEEPGPDDPLVMTGRFERGGLIQATLLPHQPESRWHLIVHTRQERLELVMPQGWPAPARLTWLDEHGQPQEQHWDDWNPWASLVELVEDTLAQGSQRPPRHDRLHADEPPPGPLAWLDEVRCLELDDAARRSLERRRVSVLDFQEVNEEATFKGTMTLVGCAMIWLALLVLILSRWIPWLGWLIAPIFALFIILQGLKWVIPPAQEKNPSSDRNKHRRGGIVSPPGRGIKVSQPGAGDVNPPAESGGR